MKMHLIFLTNRQVRQERQGKSLKEFGAASQRNGITHSDPPTPFLRGL
ncbi:hypothetical protein NSTC745_02714 [Nostoc sp. DSM 114161]|jgi:hypothetical protein